MKISVPRVGVFSVLAAFLLSSCSTSPEDCDPNDDGAFRSLFCQNAYEQRRQTLESEVQALARTTGEKKDEQSRLQLQLEEAKELRQEVEGTAREIELEIARLWETNSIEETEHELLERLLAARNTEWQEVALELERMEKDTDGLENTDGIEDTIARLSDEKQELEELLSALAQ